MLLTFIGMSFFFHGLRVWIISELFLQIFQRDDWGKTITDFAVFCYYTFFIRLKVFPTRMLSLIYSLSKYVDYPIRNIPVKGSYTVLRFCPVLDIKSLKIDLIAPFWWSLFVSIPVFLFCESIHNFWNDLSAMWILK